MYSWTQLTLHIVRANDSIYYLASFFSLSVAADNRFSFSMKTSSLLVPSLEIATRMTQNQSGPCVLSLLLLCSCPNQSSPWYPSSTASRCTVAQMSYLPSAECRRQPEMVLEVLLPFSRKTDLSLHTPQWSQDPWSQNCRTINHHSKCPSSPSNRPCLMLSPFNSLKLSCLKLQKYHKSRASWKR